MSEITFTPATQVLENKACGTIVVGRSGGGKSYFLLNLAAGCLEMGQNIFCLDAKNDMMNLRNVFPDIKVTDVNNIAPGSLDPFLVFDDVDPTVVFTIVEILCGELNPDQKLAITPIINDFVNKLKFNSEGTTFREFSQYLYSNQSQQAQMVGNQLLLNANTKYGKLIFGQEGKKSQALKIGTESRIISTFGMQLPTGSSNPKPDELVSAATVYIVCRMMKNILTRNSKQGQVGELQALNKKLQEQKSKESKRPTVIFMDECHMLMRSNAVKDIIDEILVLGRSLNTAVVLASQNVTHFDSALAQHIASKFTFGMSRQEATEFFSLFDNSSSANQLDVGNCIDNVTRLRTGFAYFIDSAGRAALMHVTTNHDHGAFSSNPLEKKQ